MQQDSGTQWDLMVMDPHLSTVEQIYVIFVVVVLVVILIKLIGIWWSAPPFRLSRRAHDPNYASKLIKVGESLKQWQAAVLFSSVIIFLEKGIATCDVLLAVRSASPLTLIAYSVRECGSFLLIGVLTAFTAFGLRWHTASRLRRIEEAIAVR